MSEDRISSLPDAILHQILSLVNIKTAVQTCALSKRWRYLWTSLPDLDFDFFNFPFSCVRCITFVDRCEEKIRFFTNFVNQVLSLRDSSDVCQFRFSSESLDNPSLVYKYISYAIRHNVQQLHLSAYCYPKPFEFPSCLFTCESLKVLKLKYYYEGMLIPKSFCLPALKTLHLELFPLRDDNGGFSFPREPFSSFPNLESLTLLNCDLSGSIISAPQLRILEILFQGYNPLFSSESEIVVSTPRLTSFKFEGQVSLFCSMEDLPCLDKVYIDLWTSFCEPYTNDVKQRMPLNLVKMLGPLRNAKDVTLSLDIVEVLAMDPGSLKSHPSPFCNLEHLKLIATWRCKSKTLTVPLNVMTYLTKGSPYGDTMVVEFPKAGMGNGDDEVIVIA